MQVVFGYLYGLSVFHDPLDLYGLLGSMIICSGVVAVTWPRRGASPDPVLGAASLPSQQTVSYEGLPLLDNDVPLEKAVELPECNGAQHKMGFPV